MNTPTFTLRVIEKTKNTGVITRAEAIRITHLRKTIRVAKCYTGKAHLALILWANAERAQLDNVFAQPLFKRK